MEVLIVCSFTVMGSQIPNLFMSAISPVSPFIPQALLRGAEGEGGEDEDEEEEESEEGAAVEAVGAPGVVVAGTEPLACLALKLVNTLMTSTPQF